MIILSSYQHRCQAPFKSSSSKTQQFIQSLYHNSSTCSSPTSSWPLVPSSPLPGLPPSRPSISSKPASIALRVLRSQISAQLAMRLMSSKMLLTARKTIILTFHPSYAATIQVNPDHPAVDFFHATAGTSLPANSGFWSNSANDASLLFRFNRFPTNGDVRLVLTDTHVVPGVSVSLVTPASDWAGSGSAIY